MCPRQSAQRSSRPLGFVNCHSGAVQGRLGLSGKALWFCCCRPNVAAVVVYRLPGEITTGLLPRADSADRAKAGVPQSPGAAARSGGPAGPAGPRRVHFGHSVRNKKRGEREETACRSRSRCSVAPRHCRSNARHAARRHGYVPLIGCAARDGLGDRPAGRPSASSSACACRCRRNRCVPKGCRAATPGRHAEHAKSR